MRMDATERRPLPSRRTETAAGGPGRPWYGLFASALLSGLAAIALGACGGSGSSQGSPATSGSDSASSVGPANETVSSTAKGLASQLTLTDESLDTLGGEWREEDLESGAKPQYLGTGPTSSRACTHHFGTIAAW